MRAFLFGFMVAAILCVAGYEFYLRVPEPDPCRACSNGTRCAAGLCVVAGVSPQLVTRKRGGARPRGNGPGYVGTSNNGLPPGVLPANAPLATIDDSSADRNSAQAPAAPEPPPPPPPPPLRPEERKLVAVGDKLTGTEVINLAEASNSGDHELSQEEIDAVFRPRQAAVVSCIDDARGEAQLEGTVTVAFRIRRSGDIAGVRVEAPAYLINHGLLDCCRRLIAPLRYPASTRAQVVTYPFSLR